MERKKYTNSLLGKSGKNAGNMEYVSISKHEILKQEPVNWILNRFLLEKNKSVDFRHLVF
jgi:hypothetical protein